MSDFKSALLTLADEAFFELVRNYLGPVKTPFNKHDLIGRLEAFLRKDEVQERIVGLIDADDAELLTAIWMLGQPDFDEIYLFFARRRSYLDLHQRLLNLEDRLLIYRVGEHLRINPILLDRLEGTVLRIDRLFASRARRASDPEPTPPWVSDTLLIALHSYLCEGPEVFRADRSLRKRSLTDLRERIAVVTEPAVPESTGADGPDKQPVLRATPLFEALIAAGAVVEDRGLYPVTEVWDELAALSPVQRIAELVAALAGDDEDVPDSLAPAIEGVMNALPAGRAMSGLSIERLLLVLAPDQTAEVCRRAREMMVITGLLIPVDEEFVIPATLPEPHDERKPLVVQPNFELMMPEEFAFEDGLLVARIAGLIRHDRYPHFELTKDRVAGALRSGLDIDAIVTRLTELAGGRLPQNIAVTMRSWAGEHESVRLFKGVVLTVEEARRATVEHSQPVQLLVRELLAPGVYLIDERDVEAMQEALGEAGVDLVPELAAPPRRGARRFVARSRSLVDHERLATFSRVFAASAQKNAPAAENRNEWLAQIHERLDDAPLTAEQREELAGRVRSKLILTAEQVRPDSLKTEKTEARGVDYVGKVRLIEQAIRTGTSLLEIIERTDDGSPRRRLVEPLEMVKHGTELIMVGEELPRRDRVELQVRKLGLVRRLRSGLVKRRARHR